MWTIPRPRASRWSGILVAAVAVVLLGACTAAAGRSPGHLVGLAGDHTGRSAAAGPQAAPAATPASTGSSPAGGAPQASAAQALAPESAIPQVGADVAQPELGLRADDLYQIYEAVMTSYVDRVDSATLLSGALKSVQTMAVERGLLPVELAILDTAPLPAATASRPADAGRGDSPANLQADWAPFGDAYDTFMRKLRGRSDVTGVGAAAARGLLGALGDPLTRYVDRAAAARMQATGDASIGAVLTPRAGEPPVIRLVVPGGPADRAGLRAGDVIVAVDGRTVPAGDVYETLEALHGAAGSQVAVSIRAAGQGNVRDVQVTRGSAALPAITADVDGSIARIRLRAFAPGVTDQLRLALNDAAAQGAGGWLIDLRGNGEGSLTEAARVASLFVGDRTLAVEEDRGGRQMPLRGSGPGLRTLLPLVMLVDGATAGPSELVAGALRDYQLATIVGTPSAGRLGTPAVVSLSDGSWAEITVRRMRSPAGTSLLGTGVVPDQTVGPEPEQLADGRDPVEEAAVALLRSGQS